MEWEMVLVCDVVIGLIGLLHYNKWQNINIISDFKFDSIIPVQKLILTFSKECAYCLN
jgi:thioredoxin-related protein